MFKKNDKLLLKVYTNKDYTGLIIDNKYATDYCTLFRHNLVNWRNKKQNVVVRSSMKLEF